jgi:hypothetical protein
MPLWKSVARTNLPASGQTNTSQSPAHSALGLGVNWPLYVFEGAELALFMISACVFSVLLFGANSPALKQFPNATLRLLLMGIGTKRFRLNKGVKRD